MIKLNGFKLMYTTEKNGKKTTEIADFLEPEFSGNTDFPTEMWQPYPKGEWRMIKMTFMQEFYCENVISSTLMDALKSFEQGSKNVRYWYMNEKGEWFGGEGIHLSELDAYINTDDYVRITFKWDANGYAPMGCLLNESQNPHT